MTAQWLSPQLLADALGLRARLLKDSIFFVGVLLMVETDTSVCTVCYASNNVHATSECAKELTEALLELYYSRKRLSRKQLKHLCVLSVSILKISEETRALLGDLGHGGPTINLEAN